MKKHLQDVLGGSNPLPTDQLVYAQWLIMKQQHSLAMLFDIVKKYHTVSSQHNYNIVFKAFLKPAQGMIIVLKKAKFKCLPIK